MKHRGDAPEHTMLIKAPAFTKAGRAWKPFRFGALERVSKRHAHLIRNLEWLVPTVPTTGDVAASVTNRLHEILDEKVSLSTEYVHLVPCSKLKQYIGAPTFLAVLAPQPHKTRGLLEIELGLAHRAIDLLLGGGGEPVALRPLTDIEEGVMTYVLVELLKVLTPALDPTLPRLRLEGLMRSFDEVQTVFGEDENLAVVQLRAAFGETSGYLRLFIPEVLLAGARPPEDATIQQTRRAQDVVNHADRLRNVKSLVRVEIAQVEITSSELAQLRERDVILVDGLTLKPDQGENGTARLYVGVGRSGRMEAELAPTNQGYTVTVGSFVIGSEVPPGEAQLGEAQANVPDSADRSDLVEGNEGADLMNDIPLQISVELARLPITAEEVLALKVGHVFDLQRTAGEPLDLSVNGRVVARGELVEVEGNLGVRIISLAG